MNNETALRKSFGNVKHMETSNAQIFFKFFILCVKIPRKAQYIL